MKRNIKLVVLLEFVILVIVVLGFEYVVLPDHGRYGGVTRLLDIYALLHILLMVIPGFLLMGEGKNFIKAFSVGRKKYTLLELKNINGAVAACQKLVLWSGIVGLVLQIITILLHMTDVPTLGYNLTIALLIILYAAVLEYLLVPVKLNAERVMNEEMDMDFEEGPEAGCFDKNAGPEADENVGADMNSGMKADAGPEADGNAGPDLDKESDVDAGTGMGGETNADAGGK